MCKVNYRRAGQLERVAYEGSLQSEEGSTLSMPQHRPLHTANAARSANYAVDTHNARSDQHGAADESVAGRLYAQLYPVPAERRFEIWTRAKGVAAPVFWPMPRDLRSDGRCREGT